MKQHRMEFSVARMAMVMGVSRSGYYAWVRNGETAFRARRRIFDMTVRTQFLARAQRLGRRQLTKELQSVGIRCSANRVYRSMRRQGFRARRSRKFVTTTDSRHSYRVAPNLLNRRFTAEKPNQVWVSDITYLPCRTGWLYLVVILDLYARRVVGWHVSHSLGHQTVLAAFSRAVRTRGPVRGLILHSDRGVQYCCDGFRTVMQRHGVVQSMSRKGDCWDNAVAESFFATVKKGFPAGLVFTDLLDARRYLFEYVEIEYHRHHYHSTLGEQTPIAYEEQYWHHIGSAVPRVG